MAVSIYQDLSHIYDDIKHRVNVNADDYIIGSAASAAWNIMCMIPNPDKDQYETVLNGIRNTFWAGQKFAEVHDNE